MSEPAEYRVIYDPRAVKELSKLDKPLARRIIRAADALGSDPRPHGCRALSGHPGLWRIRVGNFRIVYTIKDTQLMVLALRVAHRSQVYRNL